MEAILYVASRARTDLYGTLKLLYVADKFHLERYGRLIYGEDYSAMRWGPVPSSAYDIVKFVRGDRERCRNMLAKGAFSMEGDTFVLHRAPDIDELSPSDMECLDQAIHEFGHLDFAGFKNLTHDAAWKAAWDDATARSRGSVGIPLQSVASQFLDAQRIIQYLSDPHPDME